MYGHTGHVRFLTSVELPTPPSLAPAKPDSATSDADGRKSDASSSSAAPGAGGSPGNGGGSVKFPDLHRRSSMAQITATMATRMLVISGGDGYEDFRNSAANEGAGRDDSTNHLLLWQG